MHIANWYLTCKYSIYEHILRRDILYICWIEHVLEMRGKLQGIKLTSTKSSKINKSTTKEIAEWTLLAACWEDILCEKSMVIREEQICLCCRKADWEVNKTWRKFKNQWQQSSEGKRTCWMNGFPHSSFIDLNWGFSPWWNNPKSGRANTGSQQIWPSRPVRYFSLMRPFGGSSEISLVGTPIETSHDTDNASDYLFLILLSAPRSLVINPACFQQIFFRWVQEAGCCKTSVWSPHLHILDEEWNLLFWNGALALFGFWPWGISQKKKWKKS